MSISNLKRYNLNQCGEGSYCWGEMIISKKGEFIKYEEAKKEEEELIKKIAVLVWEFKFTKSNEKINDPAVKTLIQKFKSFIKNEE